MQTITNGTLGLADKLFSIWPVVTLRNCNLYMPFNCKWHHRLSSIDNNEEGQSALHSNLDFEKQELRIGALEAIQMLTGGRH